MKLVIGLGNPGAEYDGTRHNVGFEVLDRLAARHGLDLVRDRRLGARVARGTVAGADTTLVAPESYMNLSGPVVARMVRERDVPLDELLVISDDFHLALGKLRVRARGSAGGHNGLRSIIGALGSEEFARMRVGIGEPPSGSAEQFVLTRFRPAERQVMQETLDRGADCAEDWCRLGTLETMNRYNG